MDIFIRFFLPIYLAVFFLTAMLWRSLLVWKQTGVNPYRLGGNDTAHDFIGRLFRITLIACGSVAGVYAFAPNIYSFLAPITWLQQSTLIIAGSILLIISLIWVLIAQAQMGDSWRIGIDSQHKTELVQTGLYRYSRNPIFLGMRLMLIGLFLVIPNAVTLAIWLLGDCLMQIQVRLEEEHLARLHGESYARYRHRVKRWI
jgi:protein-S-isoprenylcysteine O-methyltransferase Ste14